MKMFSSYPGRHEVLSALTEFYKVATSSGCARAIYLGITRESYHIFYGLILLLKGIFYSLLTLFF